MNIYRNTIHRLTLINIRYINKVYSANVSKQSLCLHGRSAPYHAPNSEMYSLSYTCTDSTQRKSVNRKNIKLLCVNVFLILHTSVEMFSAVFFHHPSIKPHSPATLKERFQDDGVMPLQEGFDVTSRCKRAKSAQLPQPHGCLLTTRQIMLCSPIKHPNGEEMSAVFTETKPFISC